LLLLHNSNGIVESETRIQKLAFLGIEEKGLPKFTDFVWEKYGPLSKGLWKTLRRMERQGLLTIREERRYSLMGDSYAIRVFKLTDKGRLQGANLNHTHNDESRLVQELISKYGRISLDRLLSYVHTAYSSNDLGDMKL